MESKLRTTALLAVAALRAFPQAEDATPQVKGAEQEEAITGQSGMEAASRLPVSRTVGGRRLPGAGGLLPTRAPALLLGVLPADHAAQARAANPSQVGAGRALVADAVAASGAWETTASGQPVWRIEIQSPGAALTKVHFRNFAAGAGRVWVYPAAKQAILEADVDGPYTKRGRNEADGGDFWSGSVTGDTVAVEYLPAAGDYSRTVPFDIVEVGHIWESGLQPPAPDAGSGVTAAVGVEQAPRAASCHLDATCYASRYDVLARSVARLVIANERSEIFVCSGTMLNTRDNVDRRLFLTAHHCIESQYQAANTEFWWFFQTNVCNGRYLDARLQKTTGSRLLTSSFGRDNGDFTLLQMYQAAPGGTYRSGWNPASVAYGGRVVGIHHPAGSYRRISFGQHVRDQAFDNGVFYGILNTQGMVEGGSSGSPIFTEDGYLVGVLSHGPAVVHDTPELGCRIIGRFAVAYARFSIVYAKIKPFLDAPSGGTTEEPETSTKKIALGQTIEGSLSAASAKRRIGCTGCFADRYELRIKTRAKVTIEQTSAKVDTFLVLLDAASRLVASNDDVEDSNTNSRISTVLEPGTYYVDASSYSSGETGKYSLSVR